jgi:hypothetical protein
MQRYRFFFSKQHENGVERCWLHFGYFRTVEEARKWRDVLQRVYPGALIRSVPHNAATQQAATSTNLSDSQVLRLLSTGSPDAGQSSGPAAGSRPEPRKTTLEDTLSELRDSAWQTVDPDTDEVSGTGVRHLKVEIQAKPRTLGAKLPREKRKS